MLNETKPTENTLGDLALMLLRLNSERSKNVEMLSYFVEFLTRSACEGLRADKDGSTRAVLYQLGWAAEMALREYSAELRKREDIEQEAEK